MYKVFSKNDEISEEIKQKFIERLPKFEGETKYIISIGGDGTILRAMHKYLSIIDQVIFVGIHTGHLGFFMDFNYDMIDEIIQMIKENNCEMHQFNLAEATIKTKTKTKTFMCLNEFQLVKSNGVICFDLYVDDDKFENFRGNGICISTPAGSTGMNKSLGGAIVDPQLQALQITELASINSNAFRTIGSSLILNKNRKIKLNNFSENKIDICWDHLIEECEDVLELEVKLSEVVISMAYIHANPFFKRVKKAFL